MIALLPGSPISAEDWSSLTMVTLFAYLQAFLARYLSLVRLAAVERVTVVVPSIFHYVPMMEPTGLLQTFGAISNFICFLSLCLALCFNTMLSKKSTENSLDLIAWFWQVWTFIYYVQLTECGPHEFNLGWTNITMKIEGNQDCLSSIWSNIAMSLIAYVKQVFLHCFNRLSNL